VNEENLKTQFWSYKMHIGPDTISNVLFLSLSSTQFYFIALMQPSTWRKEALKGGRDPLILGYKREIKQEEYQKYKLLKFKFL
jgi:hypothetical protein